MLLPSFVIYAAGHYFCVCGPVGSKSVAHRSLLNQRALLTEILFVGEAKKNYSSFGA